NDLGTLQEELGRPDDTLAYFRKALELREQLVKEHPDETRFRDELASVLFNIGTYHGKSGNLAGAIDALRRSLGLNAGNSACYFNLGQAYKQDGRAAEALEAFRRASERGRLQTSRPEVRAGIEECAKLVAGDERLQAVLKGKAPARSAGEALALAHDCRRRSLFATAARLDEAAHALEPGALTGPEAYDCARTAVLAGCGQGKDDPPPDNATQAHLRASARDWLVKELSRTSRARASVSGADRRALVLPLRRWKSDSGLAGVREAAALAGLSEAERTAWKSFWADVEALLRTTEAE